MRKIVGLVFLGLGVALIVLAIALPSFVYPRIAKAPAEPDQYVVAQGQGITVLLAQSEADGGVRTLQNQDVTVTRRVIGEVRPNATRAEDPNVFYRLAFKTEVANQPAGTLTAYVEGVSLNGTTGLANNCCGDYLNTDGGETGDASIRHEGLTFKFPFGTRKQNYPFWDVNVKQAVTARFDGTEEIFGLETYRFVQPILDVPLYQQDVPGALFGLEQASVSADRVYSTTRTLWVEPNTGAIIKGSERVYQRLVFEGAEAPVIQGTITYNEATVRANVDNYELSAMALGFARTTGPIVSWVLGPVFLIFAAALLLADRRRTAETEWPAAGTLPLSVGR